MRTVNVHEAKTHFSRLLELVAQGEAVVIAKAGKPVARLVPLEDTPAPAPAPRRLGFLDGQFNVPDDIKTPFKDEIEAMFYGEE